MKLEINEFDETLDYTKPIYLRTMLGTIYTYTTEDDKIKLDSRIVKASNNKIELIEVGDYVNGEKVGVNGLTNKGKMVNISGLGYINIKELNNEDIKTIVTKEQFKSCEYKFEEE